MVAAIRSGQLGALDAHIDHYAASGEWIAVEGVLSARRGGKPSATRFSTWLRLRGDRIAHQIDYIDYPAANRQQKNGEAFTAGLSPYRGTGNSAQREADARRVVHDFYAAFEHLATDSAAAIDRMFRLIADSVRVEDPIGRTRVSSRADYRRNFEQAFTAQRWGAVRWVVNREVVLGDWVAVEGLFAGTISDRTFATRFSSWFQVRDGRVVHQIDYFDYPGFRRQLR